LLPLALTIFGFSASSGESERFSGAPAAGAGCSFFCLAGFLAGLAASAFAVGAFSPSDDFEAGAFCSSSEAAEACVGFDSSVFVGSSGVGSVGFWLSHNSN